MNPHLWFSPSDFLLLLLSSCLPLYTPLVAWFTPLPTSLLLCILFHLCPVCPNPALFAVSTSHFLHLCPSGPHITFFSSFPTFITPSPSFSHTIITHLLTAVTCHFTYAPFIVLTSIGRGPRWVSRAFTHKHCLSTTLFSFYTQADIKPQGVACGALRQMIPIRDIWDVSDMASYSLSMYSLMSHLLSFLCHVHVPLIIASFTLTLQ